MAYIYDADIYCDNCGRDIKCDVIRADIDSFSILGLLDTGDLVDLMDEVPESYYDSGDYPKYCSDDEESDCPQHCGNCGEFLENPLTSDGDEYVKDAVREDIESGRTDSIAVTVWKPYYDYIEYEDDDDDSDDS